MSPKLICITGSRNGYYQPYTYHIDNARHTVKQIVDYVMKENVIMVEITLRDIDRIVFHCFIPYRNTNDFWTNFLKALHAKL